MAHESGNPTWQDLPSTATPITAEALEQLETAVDRTAARPFARYYCNVAGGQNITADGTPKSIPFDVAQTTHPDVRRTDGTTYKFTLNRAGVWLIAAGVRLQSASNARHQFMIWDGTASAARYGEVATAASPDTSSWNVTALRRFPAGQVVAAGLAILTTGSDKVATDVPESTFLALQWMGP